MAVFLTILKIIGIVLLCILGFVLFLLLMLLLLPIRYKASGSIKDGDISVTAKVKYLFFISVPISFIDKKFKLAAKVFGFKVFKIGYDDKPKDEEADLEEVEDSLDDVKELKPSVSTVAKQESSKIIITQESSKVGESASESTVSEQIFKNPSSLSDTNKDEANSSVANDSVRMDESKASASEESEETEKEKKPLKEKILELIDKGVHFYKAFSDALSTELNQVGKFIKRKSTKFTYQKVKKKLIKIVMHILPRKLEGDLVIGFDDPATTGYMAAGASLLYGCYPNFDLTPDFSGKTMDGNFNLKGHIILGYIVWHGLTLIIRKKVRQCIKNAKQLVNDSKTNVNNIKEGLNYGRSEV